MENHSTSNAPNEPRGRERRQRENSRDIRITWAGRWPAWSGYLVVPVLEVLLTLGIMFISRYLPLHKYPIIYILINMLAAYFFGVGPAIFAFVLGLFVFDYFFVAPLYSIFPFESKLVDMSGIVAYLLGSSIVGISMILIRKSRQKLEDFAEKLQQSHDQFRAFIDNTPVLIYQKDRNGKLVLVNRKVAEFYGVSEDEMLGKTVYDFFPDREAADQSTANDRQVVETGQPISAKEVVPTLGRTFLTLKFPLRDSRGSVYGVGGISTDITERAQAEERERELEAHKLEFYRRLILAATNGKLVITDRSEICRITGPKIATWEIRAPNDLSVVRHGVDAAARAAGMDEIRTGEFILGIGEAATNALKHAGGGTASLHEMPDALMFMVSDTGPGITALSIPYLALREVYSTVGTLGVGYKMMIRVADRVYLATGPGGTTVALEMSLHPMKEPSELDILDKMPSLDVWTSAGIATTTEVPTSIERQDSSNP